MDELDDMNAARVYLRSLIAQRQTAVASIAQAQELVAELAAQITAARAAFQTKKQAAQDAVRDGRIGE